MKKILSRLRKINIRKIPKKFLIFGAVILIAVLFFVINSSKKEEIIQYIKVQRQDVNSTISTSGTLTGKTGTNLRFASGGKLAYLLVKEGDKVYQGQVLAGLDTQALAINLQQAQNNLRDKQAQLDKILDDIHLFQYGNGGFSNVGSANETQTQRQARTNAEVGKDNAYDNLKAAQRAFQDAVLVSPITGLVTQANPIPGQNVSASDIIVSVSDNSEVFFDAEIDESDITKVSLNQKAEVTLNAYGDKIFKGYVAEIKQATKTTSSGATVVIVRIKLNNADIRFTSGLNGQANIITSQAKNALSIPNDALRDNDNVLVKTPAGIREVQIETGISSDTLTEVKKGLKEENEVVTNPSAVRIPQNRSQNPFNRFFRGLTGGRQRGF